MPVSNPVDITDEHHHRHEYPAAEQSLPVSDENVETNDCNKQGDDGALAAKVAKASDMLLARQGPRTTTEAPQLPLIGKNNDKNKTATCENTTRATNQDSKDNVTSLDQSEASTSARKMPLLVSDGQKSDNKPSTYGRVPKEGSKVSKDPGVRFVEEFGKILKCDVKERLDKLAEPCHNLRNQLRRMTGWKYAMVGNYHDDAADLWSIELCCKKYYFIVRDDQKEKKTMPMKREATSTSKLEAWEKFASILEKQLRLVTRFLVLQGKACRNNHRIPWKVRMGYADGRYMARLRGYVPNDHTTYWSGPKAIVDSRLCDSEEEAMTHLEEKWRQKMAAKLHHG